MKAKITKMHLYFALRRANKELDKLNQLLDEMHVILIENRKKVA